MEDESAGTKGVIRLKILIALLVIVAISFIAAAIHAAGKVENILEELEREKYQ